MAGEMLGPILLSIHNLTYYQRLLAEARRRFGRGRFRRRLAGRDSVGAAGRSSTARQMAAVR